MFGSNQDRLGIAAEVMCTKRVGNETRTEDTIEQ